MLDFSAPDVIKSLLYWLKCNYYLQVIAGELYRNLALAIGCITVTTLILLSSWLGCLQVVFCVLLTLTNVAGFMHFWGKSEKLAEWSITIRLHGYFYGLSSFCSVFLGLTIETVSSTNLIISIGLCVDCPAHIAHEFLASQGTEYLILGNDGSNVVIFFIGTKIERSKKALQNMGPAVLNGGFSTFLSFVLLANSGSHVFETFFKVRPPFEYWKVGLKVRKFKSVPQQFSISQFLPLRCVRS